MTTDSIKELVKRLRDERIQHSVMGPVAMRDAAEALEAMAGEVERLKVHRDAVAKTCTLGFSEFERVKAERDRLAGEVERLKEERDAAITDRFDAAADRIKAVAAERDRLKAALVRLKTPTNISANERIVIAEEALGGDA